MKKLVVLLGVVAIVSSVQSAQRAPINGLIWRATSKDATIYLVGSVHFGDKRMYPLPPIYGVALDQASALVEEVKDTDDSAAIGEITQKYAMYPANDSLSNHLKKQTLKRVEQFCTANNLPFDRLKQVRPWVISLMIPLLPQIIAADEGGAGAKPYPGIDDYFASKARADHKPIVGVETLEFQIKLLMSLSATDQDQAINAALDSGSSSKVQADNIVADWVKGDGEDIVKMSSEAHFPRAILEDRNHRMADAAESYLKAQKPCLFVVGSLHMLGKEGIVELLRSRGYRVVQIFSAMK